MATQHTEPSAIGRRHLAGTLRGRQAVLLLFLVLFALSLVVEPRSSLGSDIGGKTATMTTLTEDGSVDIGYWAESFDPDGSLHPFFGTKHLDDMWVNVTTLPMLLLAEPLHRIGGMHLAMLLPVLGGVFAATAARRLAQLLGASDGSLAFWVIGLATPVTIYSLAFWEHAPGLALMAWGVVFVLQATQRSFVRDALAAGLMFGLAATMRQEALVYGALAGLWLISGVLRTSGLWRTVRSAVAMAGTTVAVLVANGVLEQAVLGTSFRSARAGGAASGAGSELGERLNDGLLTVVVPADVSVLGVLLGLAVVFGSLEIVRRRETPAERPLPYALVGLPFLLLLVQALVDGRSFVPSVLFTTPLVIVGAVVGWADPRSRGAVVFAVGCIPAVLAVQTTGGFEAQWGGRYLLLSGWLLTVAACTYAHALVRPALSFMVGVSAMVTLLGVAWTAERSQATGVFYEALADLDAPVVVFDSTLTARGAGDIVLDQPMLAVASAEDRAEASAVLLAAGVRSFVYSAPDLGSPAPDFEGFTATSVERLDFVSGLEFQVTTFVSAP